MSNVISRPTPYQTTISASTSESNLVTTSLPTNLLTAGTGARMDLLGKIVANATAPSVVLRSKLGSTSAIWSSTISPSSGSTSYFTLNSRLQASSTSIQEHWADLSASTSPLVGQSTESYNQSLDWQITTQINSTSGLSVALVGGMIELVRATATVRPSNPLQLTVSVVGSVSGVLNLNSLRPSAVSAIASNSASLEQIT